MLGPAAMAPLAPMKKLRGKTKVKAKAKASSNAKKTTAVPCPEIATGESASSSSLELTLKRPHTDAELALPHGNKPKASRSQQPQDITDPVTMSMNKDHYCELLEAFTAIMECEHFANMTRQPPLAISGDDSGSSHMDSPRS